jgi:hypothetical protein
MLKSAGETAGLFEASVWAAENRYYIDGKPITVSFGAYRKKTPGSCVICWKRMPLKMKLVFSSNISSDL